MPGKVNGFSVAYTVAGGVVLWSGIKGSTVSDTFRSVLAGSTTPPVTEQIGQGSPVDGSATPAGDMSAHSSTAAANQAIAKRMMPGFGWSSPDQWDALVSLWNGESGWNNMAQNPGSTAFGIAQFLDSTWATVGAKKTTDPTVQIFAGLTYIKARYGSPVNAYSKWLSRDPHWY